MRKFFIAVSVMLMCIGSVSAQKIDFGARLGLNLSNHIGNGLDMNAKPGINLGLVADMRLTKLLYIEPGLFFTMKGSKNNFGVREDDQYAKANLKFNLNYIEVPVSLGFNIPLKGDVHLRMHTGPYFALGIAGKMKADVDINVEGLELSDNGSVKAFGDGPFRRFDAGWNIGAGIKDGRLYAGLQYGAGFTEVIQYVNSYNGNFSINLGYYF